jgi:hypothetical protein
MVLRAYRMGGAFWIFKNFWQNDEAIEPAIFLTPGLPEWARVAKILEVRFHRHACCRARRHLIGSR